MNWGPPLGCLLLGLQLALLRAQGSEVVLARAGDSADLPCKGPPNSQFTWKLQPQDKPIVKSQRNMVVRGVTGLESRVDSRTREWSLGSFPLVISRLKLEDSGTYICEVKDKKPLAVELQVYKLTASPDTPRLFQGQSLNLTLQGPPGLTPSVQWQRPGSPSAQLKGLAFSVAHVKARDSGTWTCTVSLAQKTLKLHVNILVLGFQKAPYTVYARENQSAQFTFPLSSQVDALTGELSWQGGGAPSAPQPLVTFSFKEKKLSFQQVSKAPKLQMEETLPLNFTLPRALPRYAGTFNLDLQLLGGRLSQEVKLVVMQVTTTQSNVTCEVRGPVPPSLTLRLRWRNQTKASSQQSLVKVQDPEVGTWQCELMGAAGLLLTSAVEGDLLYSPANLAHEPGHGGGVPRGLPASHWLLHLLLCSVPAPQAPGPEDVSDQETPQREEDLPVLPPASENTWAPLSHRARECFPLAPPSCPPSLSGLGYWARGPDECSSHPRSPCPRCVLGSPLPGSTLPGSTHPESTLLGSTRPESTLPGSIHSESTPPGSTLPGSTYPGSTHQESLPPLLLTQVQDRPSLTLSSLSLPRGPRGGERVEGRQDQPCLSGG